MEIVGPPLATARRAHIIDKEARPEGGVDYSPTVEPSPSPACEVISAGPRGVRPMNIDDEGDVNALRPKYNSGCGRPRLPSQPPTEQRCKKQRLSPPPLSLTDITKLAQKAQADHAHLLDFFKRYLSSGYQVAQYDLVS